MMHKGSFLYKRGTKVLLALLSALLAGLLALVITSFPARMDGDISLREVGRGFENTDLFLQLAEQTVRAKIESARNMELFERDGAFDPEKTVDVRQYQNGVLDEANFNMSVTYRISDLLAFAEEDAGKMKSALEAALDESGSEAEAGEKLSARSQELETILPVSGVSLKDAAAVGSGAGVSLPDLYNNLVETSLDLAARYADYLACGDGEKSPGAPSNIAYYVENTATRAYYTNLPATSLQAARAAVEERSDLTYLFDGERRFNIMVANPEHVMSEAAGDFFMGTSFLGNGEQVLIAADLSFPVGDEIARAYGRYLDRAPVFYMTMAVMGILIVALIVLLVWSIAVNGKRFRGDTVHLLAFDRVPTEIAAGICVVGAVLWWMAASRLMAGMQPFSRRYNLMVAIRAGVLYEIALLGVLSFLRRIFGGNFWENSVVYYVVAGTRTVYSARKSSQRILILFVLFIIVNLLALLIGGVPGFIMALVLDMTALLYLMRESVGNQNIREGLKRLSKGELDYRIDTGVLTGESRETGQAVNEMGEGLEKAVESMLASERLKAELITNVSHDLKTPLTSIVNYVDLLKRRNLEDETAREYLEVLDNKTQRLKQLTEDLVEVSKITSGNIELHPTPIELKQFTWQACGEFEDRLGERGIRIECEMPDRQVNVFLDGARLWRIFENLLENVYKYGKANAPVTIRLTVEGAAPEQAVISFSNLSEAEITASAGELKERFTRGDESRRTEGFGLGLSIADSLSVAMGGSFDVVTGEHAFEAILRFPTMQTKDGRGGSS